MTTQNLIAEGATITGKIACIMRQAGFHALDTWGGRWTDGRVTFRVVKSQRCGSTGLTKEIKTLRQVWG